MAEIARRRIGLSEKWVLGPEGLWSLDILKGLSSRVPEGLTDSSLARSAWKEPLTGPLPEGTV
jgi:hypothetical protein